MFLFCFSSGKTTLLKSLTEDHLDADIQPTNGFYIKTLPIRNVVISIKEIGGLERLRKYWPNYFDEKQAILYVVNASDNDENLNKSCDALRQVLKDERLDCKPILILGKQMVKSLNLRLLWTDLETKITFSLPKVPMQTDRTHEVMTS